MKSNIDYYIEKKILSPLEVEKFSEIKDSDKKNAIALIVSYFEKLGYNVEELKKSNYNDELFIFINSSFKNNLLKDKKYKKLNKSELVKAIIELKLNVVEELRKLTNDLKNNSFDHEIFKFLNSYQFISNNVEFRFLLEPLLNKQTCSKNLIQTLTSPILKAQKDKKNGFIVYEQYIQVYKQYDNKIDKKNNFDIEFYQPINNYLQELFKTVCKINPNLSSEVDILNTPRKYNFSSRENTDIFLYLKNTGDGIAKQVNLTFTSKSFSFFKDKISVNTLQKEQIEIKTNSSVIQPAKAPFTIDINVQWNEISGESKEKLFTISLEEQEEKNIPWEDIVKEKPYTISIIEKREKLFGRNEILDTLIDNSNSNNIESYILYGQKRVGKSSIVKSLKTELDKQDNLIVIYKSMGNLKAVDPLDTFNLLGEYLCDEVIEELLIKYQNDNIKHESISQIEIPDFRGSLAPLEGFIKKIRRNHRRLKFLFILDEFDELNQEFFKPGTIGETFSINIGKGLNDFNYIGFVLVGSENMAFLNWQGMRFNNFREIRVDTFNKSNQYSPFKSVVTEPVEPHLKYDDAAIDLIYEFSNGNPYFTNLICEKAFQTAYKHKDIYIDKHDIENAILDFIDAEGKGRFEHFWSDGINTETTTNKDKTADIRKRILLAYGLAKNKSNVKVTKEEIVKNIPKPKDYAISQLEFDRVVQEFYNRNIFHKISGETVIKPRIFQEWLLKRGKNLLVEGVADLDNIIREQELEQKLYITDIELENLCERIKYMDKRLNINNVRVYLNQFGKNSIQRKAFYLLNNLIYISSYEIHTFFRKIQTQVFERKTVVLKESARKIKRENVTVCLFSKYYNENENIANSFKLFSNIDPRKKNHNLKNDVSTFTKLNNETLIIIEPIIDNIGFLKEELTNLASTVKKEQNLTASIVSLVITSKAKGELNKFLRKLENINISLFVNSTRDDNEIFPYIDSNRIFEGAEETNKNFGAMRSVFPSLKKDALLLLFENYCPNRSIPILWKKTSEFNPLFTNDYSTEDASGIDEDNRLRTYKVNTKLSQKINKYIVDNLKEKSIDGRWLDVKLIPSEVIKKVNDRWVDEKQKHKPESYLDFIDYKKIINRHDDLRKVFSVKKENLNWLDKLNELRRDPAHPEKPAPKTEDVEYFENIAIIVIKKMV
tara:strand:+ start:8824 stop:12336 length:3513 start_codon:yes stop_codon:yes gene_type:complete